MRRELQLEWELEEPLEVQRQWVGQRVEVKQLAVLLELGELLVELLLLVLE